MKQIYLYMIFILSLCTTAVAQEEKVNCELSVINFGDIGSDSNLYIRKGEGEAFFPISCRSSSVAPPITYKGAAILDFYKKDPSVELGYKRIGACLVNPRYKRAIILAYPSRNKDKVLFTAINSSLENMPFGSRLVINRTNTQLRGLYHTLPKQKKQMKRSFSLQPGGKKLVKALDLNSPAFTPHQIRMQYSIQDSNKWEQLCDTRWFNTPNKRNIIFIYHKNGAMFSKGVSDATIRPTTAPIPTVDPKKEEQRRKALAEQNKRRDKAFKDSMKKSYERRLKQIEQEHKK